MRQLLPLMLFLALLAGCASGQKQYETRIDGASAHTSDHQSTRSAADTTTTKITITPAAPSQALARQPLAVQRTVISPPLPPASPTMLPESAKWSPTVVNVQAAASAPQPVHLSVAGRNVDAPAGSAVTLEIQDTGAPAETRRDREAEGLGASIRTGSKDLTAGFNASSPDVKLAPVSGIGQSGGGGAAEGGGMAANVVTQLGEAISAASKGATAMWVIAILCFLSAVGVVLFDVIVKKSFNFLLVGILAGVGMLFVGLALVIEQHPEMLILGVLAAIGGFAFYLYHRNAVTAAASPSSPPVPPTAASNAPPSAAATAAPQGTTANDPTLLGELKTEVDYLLSKAKL